uniref:Ras- protein Rab-38 n=1 Tax=Sphaerodactylus townsendi TaxID=933632 RepID=A0ACB8FFI4_9SAUR
MTRVYYREAMGAFIVFDVTRPATFEAVTKWKEDLDTKLSLPNGNPVPTVLLANKCDQGKEPLVNNGIKMEQFCAENGFVGWFETSAKMPNMRSNREPQPLLQGLSLCGAFL